VRSVTYHLGGDGGGAGEVGVWWSTIVSQLYRYSSSAINSTAKAALEVTETRSPVKQAHLPWVGGGAGGEAAGAGAGVSGEGLE